jgi:hypothetical protein
MALYLVRRPSKRGLLNAIIASAADSGSALTAAKSESDQVTDNWSVDLLTDLIDADTPARVYTRNGLTLAGERKPGQ